MRIWIRDPVSFDPWIRDLGWVKSQDPDSGLTINIPDHISESLKTIFWVKILQFFDADADPGTGNLVDPGPEIWGGKIFKSRFGIKHLESATLQKIVAGTGFVYGSALFCTVLRVPSRYGNVHFNSTVPRSSAGPWTT